MNRYTVEDFEELGNIADEICCEKKFNPSMFKKNTKDDGNTKSKGKNKPKFMNKKTAEEKVDEGYLVEFEENCGIPWEPINETFPSDFFDKPDDFEKSDEDPDDSYEPENDERHINTTQSELGEVPIIDDSDEDEPIVSPEENDPGYDDEKIGSKIRSNADMETEDDYGYDPDEEMSPVRSFSRKEIEPDNSLDLPDGESTPDETQTADKVTLEFDDGEVMDFDSNQFPTEDIIKNLTTDKIGDSEDDDFVARIVSINGVPAEVWGRSHGIADVKPGRPHEKYETPNSNDEDDIDDDTPDTEIPVNDGYFDI